MTSSEHAYLPKAPTYNKLTRGQGWGWKWRAGVSIQSIEANIGSCATSFIYQKDTSNSSVEDELEPSLT